jgi:charged multivesicular body protein 1
MFHIFVQVSQLMDRFEKDFENLDVQSAAMEGSMQATTTLTAPQGQVDALMQQVADEAGYVFISHIDYVQIISLFVLVYRLELNMEMPSGAQTAIGASTQASTEQVSVCVMLLVLHFYSSTFQDELSQRLAQLRQT